MPDLPLHTQLLHLADGMSAEDAATLGKAAGELQELGQRRADLFAALKSTTFALARREGLTSNQAFALMEGRWMDDAPSSVLPILEQARAVLAREKEDA